MNQLKHFFVIMDHVHKLSDHPFCDYGQSPHYFIIIPLTTDQDKAFFSLTQKVLIFSYYSIKHILWVLKYFKCFFFFSFFFFFNQKY